MGGDDSGFSGSATVVQGILQFKGESSVPSTWAINVDAGAAIAVSVGATGDWSSADIDTLLSAAKFFDGSLFGINTTDAGSAKFTLAGEIDDGYNAKVGFIKLGSGTLETLWHELLLGRNNGCRRYFAGRVGLHYVKRGFLFFAVWFRRNNYKLRQR